MTGSNVVLEVKDLVTHFPTRTGVVKAVDGVSFKIERGKTLCVSCKSSIRPAVSFRAR